MRSTSSFRHLEVWRESMTLVEEIYKHDEIQQRVDRIGRMLNGLIASLQAEDER